jgi:hypothetical protein
VQCRVRAAGGRAPGANRQGMHNRVLQESLAAFVEEAAWQLAEHGHAPVEHVLDCQYWLCHGILYGVTDFV